MGSIMLSAHFAMPLSVYKYIFVSEYVPQALLADSLVFDTPAIHQGRTLIFQQ